MRRKLQKRAFRDIDRGALGAMLFGARKRKRMTQAELASRIHRDRPWVSDVETGKIMHVPDNDLDAVAPILDLEVAMLRRARAQSTPRAAVVSPAASGTVDRGCGMCGASNPWDAQFCVHCGEELPLETVCDTCGRIIRADSRFCAYCGEPVSSSIPAT